MDTKSQCCRNKKEAIWCYLGKSEGFLEDELNWVLPDEWELSHKKTELVLQAAGTVSTKTKKWEKAHHEAYTQLFLNARVKKVGGLNPKTQVNVLQMWCGPNWKVNPLPI